MKKEISVALWVVLALIFTFTDIFVTPTAMNHTTGNVRWLVMGLSSLVVVPYLALIYRLIRYFYRLSVKKQLHDYLKNQF